MATAQEMQKFKEDQRSVELSGANDEAALAALAKYNFESTDEGRLRSVLEDPDAYQHINYMLRDKNGVFLWVHGSAEQSIKMTYLESEWAAEGGSPFANLTKKVRPSF